jgi:hypothetical protein
MITVLGVAGTRGHQEGTGLRNLLASYREPHARWKNYICAGTCHVSMQRFTQSDEVVSRTFVLSSNQYVSVPVFSGGWPHAISVAPVRPGSILGWQNSPPLSSRDASTPRSMVARISLAVESATPARSWIPGGRNNGAAD